MRTRWIAVSLVLTLLAGGCGGAARENGGAQTAPAPAGQQDAAPSPKQWEQPPAMQIDLNKEYTATIKTSLGDIRIRLWPKDAPNAVNNFVFLAREGFYDGVIFHRVIKNFMIQGGDPTGTGRGGPGYRFAEELPPKRSYDPGIVAMARTTQPNSQGSQFFICNGQDCKGLDQKPEYTQFGEVTEGMEVVLKISDLETDVSDRPKEPPVIQTVVVEEK